MKPYDWKRSRGFDWKSGFDGRPVARVTPRRVAAIILLSPKGAMQITPVASVEPVLARV